MSVGGSLAAAPTTENYTGAMLPLAPTSNASALASNALALGVRSINDGNEAVKDFYRLNLLAMGGPAAQNFQALAGGQELPKLPAHHPVYREKFRNYGKVTMSLNKPTLSTCIYK